MQVTLPKLPLWEMGSTSGDTQLQITLPRTTQGDSLEAVPLWSLTLVYSITLHYRVPQQTSHWSQSDRGDHRPLIKPHVQNARGILHSQFPLFNGQEGGNPQSRGGTPGLPEATTSLPSWVFTGRYGQHHGPFQPLPLAQYSREGHQPYSSPVAGQLHQPVWMMHCTFKRK